MEILSRFEDILALVEKYLQNEAGRYAAYQKRRKTPVFRHGDIRRVHLMRPNSDLSSCLSP